jgi:hypothetical protein
MLKKLALLSIVSFICVAACNVLDSTMLFYRHIVTLETNLDSLRYDQTYLNSTTVYPYTIINLYETSILSNSITLYPISDSGQIYFSIYRGEGYDDIPNTSFIDSLTIYTPIDTTIVIFRSGEGIDSIIINPDI